MNKKLLTAFMCILALAVVPTSALAKMGKGHHSPSLEEKFFKKVKKVYKHQEELGVTDGQLDQIKELKIALKKDLIQGQADIDILAVDIKALLYNDPIDVEAVNKLVDQKYAAKASRTKRIVESFAQFKSILSKEQKDKLHKLMAKKKMGYERKGNR